MVAPGDTGGDADAEVGGPREVCDEPGDEDGDGWEECDDPDCASAPACQGISPSPAALAPSIARGDILERYGFLFDEQAPIQREAQPEAFEAALAAHVRGRVVDYTTGDPVAGARVRVVDQGFAGYMPTTRSGVLDMLVHGTGSGQTRLSVSAPGYTPYQTRARIEPGADIDLGVLRLLPLAEPLAPLSSMSPAMQVIEGAPTVDERGERTTRVLMRPMTRVTAVGDDGTETELAQASVRITEVSVGGPAQGAMSAPLPAYSGYTWAADFSVAEAPDASRVRFDPPVVAHLDEFLDFAPGSRVPLGFYDESEGAWLEYEAATVVRVVDIVDGVASLDIGAGPEAEGPAELAAIGVTDEELAEIGATRQPGDRFWRMELPHFSLWDANMGIICALDPDPRGASCTPLEAAKSTWRWFQTPSCERGSTIECDNRSVIQTVGLMGTQRNLHHRSDWQVGYLERRILRIPLVPTNVVPQANPGALEYRLQVTVAGRVIHQETYSSSEARNLNFVEIPWDGRDAYNRRVDDIAQLAHVVIDIDYPSRAGSNGNFNDPTGDPVQSGEVIVREPGRLTRRTKYTVGIDARYDDSGVDAGGWMLSGYHRMQADGSVRRGDGGVITPASRAESTIIETESGTGGPVASLRTGELVMVQGSGKCLVRLDPRVPDSEDVILGACSGDVPTGRTLADFNFGQPATDSRFGQIAGVHVSPGGDVYVWQSDTFRKNRPSFIARIRPLSDRKGADFGPLEHVAGNGEYGAFDGPDAGDARAEPVQITDMAVSPNGEVYVAQEDLDCILRVGNTGRLTRFAGQCQVDPARGTRTGYGERVGEGDYFGLPNALDVGLDGQLHVSRAQLGDLVRIGPSGIVEHIAGSSSRLNPGDEFNAERVVDGMDARELNNGFSDHFSDVVVAADDSVYVLRTRFGRVDRIDSNGKIWGHTPELSFSSSLELVATGEIVVERSPFENGLYGTGIRRNDPNDGLPLVVDPDGLIAYVFDDDGRHVRTQHAMSHEVLERFVHDADGRLVEIIDRDGRSTTLTREAGTGRLTRITGPDGQASALEYDAGGDLVRVRWADGKTVSIGYTPESKGLISRVTTPRGFDKTYTYSPRGLLETATDETGATQTYSEEPLTENGRFGRVITRTSPDGRTKRWELALFPERETSWVTHVDGLGRTQLVRSSPNGHEATTSTGEFTRMLFESDPHFGQMVDRLSGAYTILPSGDTLETEYTHEVTYADDDPTQLASYTSRMTRSGVTGEWVSTYDVATRTYTTTSPEGRTSRVTLDEKMRMIERQEGNLAIQRARWDEQTGRLLETSVVDPNDATNVRTQTYSYVEAAGLLETGMVASVTDSIGRVTEYEYDLAANLKRVLLPALTGAQSDDARTVELERDDGGNLVRLAPFGQDQHLMGWDERGAQTSGAMPAVANNSGQTGYDWTDDGMMTTATDAAGGALSFTYDPDVMQLATQENTAERKRFTHDRVSGLLTRVDATGKQSWASDRGYEFEYDGSRVVAEHWLDGTGARWASVGYGYDEAFRRDLITIGGSPVIPMSHDDDGLVTQMGPASMVYLADRPQLERLEIDTVGVGMSHDAFGALIDVSALDGAGQELLGRTVERDALGRITSVTETSEGQAEQTTLYTYDPQGRLLAVHRDTNADGVGQPGELWEEYERDERGNEISLIVAGQPISGFTVNAQDQVTAHGDLRLTYNALGQADEISFVGEPSRTLELEHDPDHTLRFVRFSDGTTRTYDLDAFGRQAHVVDRDAAGITTAQRRYLYLQGSNPIAEVDAQGNPLKTFIYATGGNAPDAIVDEVTGTTHILIKDERGSVRVVADAATGQVVQRLEYTSHGLVLTDTNPGFQPFGFHGGMHDERTGLIRFGARHYLPELGRFIEPDPLEWSGGHTNLYAYAAFDPVNSSDPTGLYVETAGDVAFIAYDVFAIVRDNVIGNCDNLAENLLALAADAASLLIPGMVGAGLAVRAAIKARWAKRAAKGCSFTDETTVQMCDGELRPIGEVSVGEFVMARDPDTGEDGCREVTALHRRHVKQVYELELTDERGVVQVDHVTGEHPYKVAGGGFVAVDLLEPGVVLEGYEGLLKLTGKTLVQGDFIVYNLSVEGVETFFVGGVGSWVHNCPASPGQIVDALRSSLRSRSGFRPDGHPLILDENLSAQGMADALRAHGHNIRSVEEIFGAGGVLDPTILDFAQTIGARVVTRDRGRQLDGGFQGLGIIVDSRISSPSSISRIINEAL